MLPIENMKFGHGGRKGRTRKVMAAEDHTPRWRRRLAWSSDRLKIKKIVGDRPSFFASLLGIVLRFFLPALLYADTSDCFLSSLPPSSHRASVLLRSHLATSRPVRYTSSVAIRSTMYDTHLRATHTTTSSIRGVQIPIYLVSDATDSLQRSVAVLKLYQ